MSSKTSCLNLKNYQQIVIHIFSESLCDNQKNSFLHLVYNNLCLWVDFGWVQQQVRMWGGLHSSWGAGCPWEMRRPVNRITISEEVKNIDSFCFLCFCISEIDSLASKP